MDENPYKAPQTEAGGPPPIPTNHVGGCLMLLLVTACVVLFVLALLSALVYLLGPWH